MSNRRSNYTHASDVTVIKTDGTVSQQRRYSPSELNTVKSNRHSKKVARIVQQKTDPVLVKYLDLINADN